EVFDWELPDPPSYRTLLDLDWHRLAQNAPESTGAAPHDFVEDAYRRLASYRIGYPVHLDEPRQGPGIARAIQPERIQRGLSRASALGTMATLDLGAGRPLASRWPK